MEMSPVLALLVGLVGGALTGALIAWLAARNRGSVALSQHALERARLEEKLAAEAAAASRLQQDRTLLETRFETARNQLDEARDEVAKLEERASRVVPLEAEIAQLRIRLDSAESTQADTRVALEQRIAELTTSLEAEKKQAQEKLTLLAQARDELTLQFKSLANEILEEKSKRFAEQNQSSLKQLLDPLGIRLKEFQGKVEEVYVQEGKDRVALAEQVKQLLGLNQQLSQDAHNLTLALKGQAKSRGNWGEIILERVLEASGLRKGHEYVVQESHSREDGARLQPDVIINLPGAKHLVVDSKVSLIAHDEYVNASDENAKDAALRKLLASVRTHINSLSQKNYQTLYSLASLDCVLLFVPIEPAFLTAVSNDDQLWQDAWRKNILLVSPSTLLFVLRTVAHLWSQEQQSRNAQEIARRGAELYDKLAGFVEELNKVGERLKQAQTSYDEALEKLAGRRGNVIRQAEMLKDLGVKPTKSLPTSVLELSDPGMAAMPEQKLPDASSADQSQ
jgi:DNA recombination protein RmuC